jgi:hypothetical protein
VCISGWPTVDLPVMTNVLFRLMVAFFFELEANDCIEDKGIMIKFFPRILHLHKYIECDD